LCHFTEGHTNKKNKKMNLNVKMNMNMEKNAKMKMQLHPMLQMGMRCYRFAGCPGDQTKAAGQEGTAKMPGCNMLWLVCAVDPKGPVSKDAREQPAAATPALGHPAALRAGGKYGTGT
jgi:hypothetical protein